MNILFETVPNKGMELRSLRRNISRTMESKFHMPSGSRPRNGLKKLHHSEADGGAVVDK